MSVLAPLALDPPLDPSGDEGRSALRRELANPDYHQTDPVERLLTWIYRRLQDGVDVASNAPTVPTFFGILVLLGLVLAVGLLLSRARRTARADAARTPALGEERITAAALRTRAEAALDDGRYDDALVDGFRALAVRQVERGRIEDLPQATAHELARALGAGFPDEQHRIDRSADLFDAVLYGDHPAGRDQAVAVLDLDLALDGAVTRR